MLLPHDPAITLQKCVKLLTMLEHEKHLYCSVMQEFICKYMGVSENIVL